VRSLVGMRGLPGGGEPRGAPVAASVSGVCVFVERPAAAAVFDLLALRAEGGPAGPAWTRLAEAEFFPVLDEFGQFRHADWPRKTRSIEDLRARAAEEEADLAAHPGPADRDAWGGWAAGPRLEATGFFRVAKHEGRWWLVDPDGRLFWSHGITGVRAHSATTPLTDRERYFTLPPANTPLGAFHGSASNAPRGHYAGRRFATYNFTGANLQRKYGDGWLPAFAAMSHRRLRSWGMNTVANWSQPEVYLERRTPYVVAIHFGAPTIASSQGTWGKFPDPFDPGHAAALAARMAKEKGASAGDPWCLGYFVDNELEWGDGTSLPLAVLRSPAAQPAKRAFADDLRARHGTIEALNAAWGTAHASWDALLGATGPPDAKRAAADLRAFAARLAEAYFRNVREAVRAAAPRQLYLGCRFAGSAPAFAAAAAAHGCDVVSYNLYRRDVADFRLPDGADRPVIVGEFHFGALDRGLFHPGLQKVADQAARGDAYRAYVGGALRNPQIVGTHWFQYGDQATTGRNDGENYQIGFLDVCDTPYPETIAAAREIGAALYERRAGAPAP
jgi:hypothetical protein